MRDGSAARNVYRKRERIFLFLPSYLSLLIYLPPNNVVLFSSFSSVKNNLLYVSISREFRSFFAQKKKRSLMEAGKNVVWIEDFS